jgi:hypothetical protein
MDEISKAEYPASLSIVTAANQILREKLAQAEAVISAAEDLSTHPFLYSEAALRNVSLKARWDHFAKALDEYRGGE